MARAEREDIPALLADMDVVVLPSTSEGFPLAALEANVDALGVGDEVEVVRADAVAYARGAADGGEWDLVFCDPPYADPLEPIGREVIERSWWRRVCVLEHAARTAPPPAPEGVRPDTRTYGDTAVTGDRRPITDDA